MSDYIFLLSCFRCLAMLPLLVIISFVLLSSNAQKYLSYDIPTIQNEVAYQEESNSYCIDPIVTLDLFGLQTSNGTANGDNLSGLYYALEEVVITVKTSSPLETLSWHSVKGVSTDDLHTLLEAAVWRIFAGAPNPDPDPLSAKQSLVRDIFSSCPSPLFSISRSVCEMPFSAFGTACVSIGTDKDVIVDLHVTKRFNRRLHTYLPIGILLVYFAGYLAKSKIFQVKTKSFLLSSCIFYRPSIKYLVLVLKCGGYISSGRADFTGSLHSAKDFTSFGDTERKCGLSSGSAHCSVNRIVHLLIWSYISVVLEEYFTTECLDFGKLGDFFRVFCGCCHFWTVCHSFSTSQGKLQTCTDSRSEVGATCGGHWPGLQLLLLSADLPVGNHFARLAVCLLRLQ